MTEAEHKDKARKYVDRILEVNRQHGVDKNPAVIEYDHAVEAAASTFKSLRNEGGDKTDDDDREDRATEST